MIHTQMEILLPYTYPFFATENILIHFSSCLLLEPYFFFILVIFFIALI